jgi:hypothetical protein
MHQFTFEFNDHKETFPVWDEWNMADQELEVIYEIRDGRVSIDSVKVRVDTCTGFQTVELIHILSALSGLLDIKRAAEDNWESRKQARIKAANMQQILKIK